LHFLLGCQLDVVVVDVVVGVVVVVVGVVDVVVVVVDVVDVVVVVVAVVGVVVGVVVVAAFGLYFDLIVVTAVVAVNFAFI
jgi:hypothetical protein